MRKSTIFCNFLLIFVYIDMNYSYQTETRIISGKEAAVGQFPWQTILKRDEFDDLLCGGSIIADKWVLTAGHCTYGLQSVFLIFGSIILDNANAYNMTSTQLFLHPQYDSLTLHNDVSLILLPQKLIFSSTIAPISLVSSAEVNNNFIGTLAVISGFGLVEDINLDFSQNLLYAFVSVVSNEYCEKIYGHDIVINSTLCAIGASGSNMSICSGDSGGPLITKDENGTFVQIGINSFVKQDTCTYKYPSAYARLTDFLEFIEDTIKQQSNDITFL